jgi:hypothetical protein
MRGFGVALCFALVALSANAQTSAQTITLAGMIDCMKDAIAAGSVEHDGNGIIFSCAAAKAKTLYNFLGRKIRAEVVLDRNGKFENRQFGNSACYHQVEDQSGKATDEFRCDLIMTVGDDALSD